MLKASNVDRSLKILIQGYNRISPGLTSLFVPTMDYTCDTLHIRIARTFSERKQEHNAYLLIDPNPDNSALVKWLLEGRQIQIKIVPVLAQARISMLSDYPRPIMCKET